MELRDRGDQVRRVFRRATFHGSFRTASNNPLRIGGHSTWGEFFAGQVDDVPIHNRALTVGEIQADRNGSVQYYGPAPSRR